ncbi:MAG: hypothetical protein C0622_10780 [Desulfuromonas sp.]|nr:MAG: hypothetical protein C0622_10780 [Desulfuromonas sp.]
MGVLIVLLVATGAIAWALTLVFVWLVRRQRSRSAAVVGCGILGGIAGALLSSNKVAPLFSAGGDVVVISNRSICVVVGIAIFMSLGAIGCLVKNKSRLN